MKAKVPNRKSLLCIIHTHPKYKLIKENDAWESWLLVRYGVSSCKELCDEELQEVIAILNERIGDRDYIKRTYRGQMSRAQDKKIKALLTRLGWSDKAYFNFIKRQLGDLKIPYALTKQEATKVITGLQKIIGER